MNRFRCVSILFGLLTTHAVTAPPLTRRPRKPPSWPRWST